MPLKKVFLMTTLLVCLSFSGCIGESDLDEPQLSDLDDDGIIDSKDEDIDGDGVSNNDDKFPYDKLEHLDSDGDGIGNNQDTDDDNDGTLDTDDKFPLDSSEQLDFDDDGIGDSTDFDDDDDGWDDYEEIRCNSDYQDNSSMPEDKDGDRICDVIDPDIVGLLDRFRTDKYLTQYQGDNHEAYAINITTWQNDLGGWEKDFAEEYTKPWDGVEARTYYQFENGTETASLANKGTTKEIRYIADAFINSSNNSNRTIFKESLEGGIHWILNSQHPAGGWGKVYPSRGCGDCNYSDMMTFNDHVMTTAVLLLLDIVEKKEPFNSEIMENVNLSSVENSLERAMSFILNSQIIVNGSRTIWGQQHDPYTFESVPGRSFERECRTPNESVGIVALLLNWEDRTPEIINATWGAVDWYERNVVLDYWFNKSNNGTIEYREGEFLWYRYYNLTNDDYFFANRDSIKVYTIDELEISLKAGYRWAGSWGEALIKESSKISKDQRF